MRFAAAVLLLGLAHASSAVPCVVLLHGLVRSASAMEPMADALGKLGYVIANIDYPSREGTIEELAAPAVEAGVRSCAEQDATPVNFVTHSLGGILVRFYLADHTIADLGRVVMLAPPNHGSEVVDNLADTPGFALLNGPAGLQLGTGEDSIPNRLGRANFEVGIIAGTRTFNPLLSQYLPNPDDGKVSVASAKLEGMKDFIELPYTHTFMMRSDEVNGQVAHFLEFGRFAHGERESGSD